MKLSEFLKTIPEETLVQVFYVYWEFQHESTAKDIIEAFKNEKIFDLALEDECTRFYTGYMVREEQYEQINRRAEATSSRPGARRPGGVNRGRL